MSSSIRQTNWRAHPQHVGLGIAATIAICVGISGCGDDDSLRAEPQATERRSVPWSLVEVKSLDTLRIVSHVPYCVEEFEPRITQVKVDESRRVIDITVEAEVASTRPGERTVACLGAGKPLYRNVKLSQPLEGRTVVDGSLDPPKRRWPK